MAQNNPVAFIPAPKIREELGLSPSQFFRWRKNFGSHLPWMTIGLRSPVIAREDWEAVKDSWRVGASETVIAAFIAKACETDDLEAVDQMIARLTEVRAEIEVTTNAEVNGHGD